MRTALRIIALSVLFLGTAFWFFGGPNLGWTKTSVPVVLKDPVTEQEYTEWRQNFVPGVDFLALCGVGSAILAAAAWFMPARGSAVTPGHPPAA